MSSLASCASRTAILAGLVVLPAAVQAAPMYTGQVVVNGLLNPRGVTVDPLGRILVSESGSGGSTCDVPGAPPAPPTALRCWGQTGAVLRYDPATNTHSRPWSLLDSIAKSSNPNDLSPVAGLQDLTFTTDGRLLGVFGFRGDPATRPTGTTFATLVQFDSSSSTPTVLADLGAFETAFPSHTPPFSNPFSLAWNAGVSYITDAGANRLLKVNDASSVVEKLEDFPKIVSTIPPAEAVPTGLAASPTGTLYNTQLPGFPFTPGTASIFASTGAPNSAATIASGFTNVMDLSFGADGWLYVVEYAQDFLSPVGTGSLRRLNPTTLERQLLADSIDRPTGVLALPDGTVYVATGGSTTSGALVRYTPGPLPIAGAVIAWRQARVLRRRVRRHAL
ncbi:MAG: ScyD/ScyE family protein [Cyanobacteriota bacterium]|nr:ScyD/ScyE family protein [Cyanobacteriota bacterium]